MAQSGMRGQVLTGSAVGIIEIPLRNKSLQRSTCDIFGDSSTLLPCKAYNSTTLTGSVDALTEGERMLLLKACQGGTKVLPYLLGQAMPPFEHAAVQPQDTFSHTLEAPIAVGSVLFVEQVFALVPQVQQDSLFAGRVCMHCGTCRNAAFTNRCEGFRCFDCQMPYCSSFCQDAFSKRHKEECGLMKHVVPLARQFDLPVWLVFLFFRFSSCTEAPFHFVYELYRETENSFEDHPIWTNNAHNKQLMDNIVKFASHLKQNHEKYMAAHTDTHAHDLEQNTESKAKNIDNNHNSTPKKKHRLSNEKMSVQSLLRLFAHTFMGHCDVAPSEMAINPKQLLSHKVHIFAPSLLSRFTHSCEPNCVVFVQVPDAGRNCDGTLSSFPTARVVATRFIPSNTPLTLNFSHVTEINVHLPLATLSRQPLNPKVLTHSADCEKCIGQNGNLVPSRALVCFNCQRQNREGYLTPFTTTSLSASTTFTSNSTSTVEGWKCTVCGVLRDPVAQHIIETEKKLSQSIFQQALRPAYSFGVAGVAPSLKLWERHAKSLHPQHYLTKSLLVCLNNFAASPQVRFVAAARLFLINASQQAPLSPFLIESLLSLAAAAEQHCLARKTARSNRTHHGDDEKSDLEILLASRSLAALFAYLLVRWRLPLVPPYARAVNEWTCGNLISTLGDRPERWFDSLRMQIASLRRVLYLTGRTEPFSFAHISVESLSASQGRSQKDPFGFITNGRVNPFFVTGTEDSQNALSKAEYDMTNTLRVWFEIHAMIDRGVSGNVFREYLERIVLQFGSVVVRSAFSLKIVSSGLSLLAYAVTRAQSDIAAVMLEFGADPFAQNEWGVTAFYAASATGLGAFTGSRIATGTLKPISNTAQLSAIYTGPYALPIHVNDPKQHFSLLPATNENRTFFETFAKRIQMQQMALSKNSLMKSKAVATILKAFTARADFLANPKNRKLKDTAANRLESHQPKGLLRVCPVDPTWPLSTQQMEAANAVTSASEIPMKLFSEFRGAAMALIPHRLLTGNHGSLLLASLSTRNDGLSLLYAPLINFDVLKSDSLTSNRNNNINNGTQSRGEGFIATDENTANSLLHGAFNGSVVAVEKILKNLAIALLQKLQFNKTDHFIGKDAKDAKDNDTAALLTRVVDKMKFFKDASSNQEGALQRLLLPPLFGAMLGMQELVLGKLVQIFGCDPIMLSAPYSVNSRNLRNKITPFHGLALAPFLFSRNNTCRISSRDPLVDWQATSVLFCKRLFVKENFSSMKSDLEILYDSEEFEFDYSYNSDEERLIEQFDEKNDIFKQNHRHDYQKDNSNNSNNISLENGCENCLCAFEIGPLNRVLAVDSNIPMFLLRPDTFHSRLQKLLRILLLINTFHRLDFNLLKRIPTCEMFCGEKESVHLLPYQLFLKCWRQLLKARNTALQGGCYVTNGKKHPTVHRIPLSGNSLCGRLFYMHQQLTKREQKQLNDGWRALDLVVRQIAKIFKSGVPQPENQPYIPKPRGNPLQFIKQMTYAQTNNNTTNPVPTPYPLAQSTSQSQSLLSGRQKNNPTLNHTPNTAQLPQSNTNRNVIELSQSQSRSTLPNEKSPLESLRRSNRNNSQRFNAVQPLKSEYPNDAESQFTY